METMKISGFLAASILIAVAGTAGAEDIGKREYDRQCAACHGTKGKGDGPKAAVTKVSVADLSTLTKRHNGVFPSQRIHAVIDGREAVKGHGAREMPVWGDRYIVEAHVFLPYDPHVFAAYSDGESQPEVYVRKRIVALTEHVMRLQEK